MCKTSEREKTRKLRSLLTRRPDFPISGNVVPFLTSKKENAEWGAQELLHFYAYFIISQNRSFAQKI